MSHEAAVLFRKACMAWVVFYMVALLGLGDAAWTAAPVPLLTAHAPGAELVNGALEALDARSGQVLCMLLLGLAVLCWRGAGVLPGLLLWLLFRLVTARTWIASNGGIQLMDTMLLWSALMRETVSGWERIPSGIPAGTSRSPCSMRRRAPMSPRGSNEVRRR